MTRARAVRVEVRAALDGRGPDRGPALVFDLAAIAARMDAVAAAGRRHDVRVLFAMKSFAHPALWALAAARLDGLDAGNAAEARAAAGARIVSITSPTADPFVPSQGPSPFVPSEGPQGPSRRTDVRITCEDAAAAAHAPPHARLAVRFAASHLVPGDDAVGGILDGSGARSSRFGVRVGEPGWRDAVAAIARAGGDRVRGVHVHHGGVAPADPARLVACARAALAAADEAGLALEWLNLGGGLHLLPDLDLALAAVRAAVPPAIELVVEPGRLFARDAGFAIGHVRAARELADRSVRVVDLSRACHLRWQHVTPLAAPAPTGAARPVVFAGPTCYEEDIVGEWKLAPDRFPVGAPLIVAGVDGYAVGWNTGFGGIAPAEVVLVD